MRVWVGGGTGLLAALALVAGAVRLLGRRSVPTLPLRRPLGATDQEQVRALIAGERRVEAVDLVRRRHRLAADDAGEVVDDVAAHPDYPADWSALAAALDEEVRAEVRGLVAQGRRSAALRLVAARFDLPLPDADRLVCALTQESSGDGE